MLISQNNLDDHRLPFTALKCRGTFRRKICCSPRALAINEIFQDLIAPAQRLFSNHITIRTALIPWKAPSPPHSQDNQSPGRTWFVVPLQRLEFILRTLICVQRHPVV